MQVTEDDARMTVIQFLLSELMVSAWEATMLQRKLETKLSAVLI